MKSILFDKYGYFGTACDYPSNQIYLYYSNGTYTGKSITTPGFPTYIGFDSKSRFVILSFYRISIYDKISNNSKIIPSTTTATTIRRTTTTVAISGFI